MSSSEPDAPDLASLVRAHRRRLGLSQEALAERTHPAISMDTLAKIERGRSRPYFATLDALATALGLDSGERARLHAARLVARAQANAAVPARAGGPASGAWHQVFAPEAVPTAPTRSS